MEELFFLIYKQFISKPVPVFLAFSSRQLSVLQWCSFKDDIWELSVRVGGRGRGGVITLAKCSLAAQQTVAPRRYPGCFYNKATWRKSSQWQSPVRQVHESTGSCQKLTSESHIHLWNALLLPQICESSPGPTKLKYANRLLVELHVDTETDVCFPEALFVKEMVA